MSDEKLAQQSNWNAAIAATQEAYLGEILGKYIEADAKLRIVQGQNKAMQESIRIANENEELYRETEKELIAMTSNKKAFEEQNNQMKDEQVNLTNAINALKRELQDAKLERQRAQEAELAAKEELARLKKRRTRSKTVKSDVAHGEHNTDKAE